MSHAGTEDKFIKTLFPENMEDLEVLDIGHGYGETALYIRTRTYKGGWCKLTGLEIFREYHELQQRLGIYDTLTLGDARHMPYRDKAFNITIGQHVIEHLPKPDGVKMLSEAERVTRNRVIICTPHGYTESGPLDENQHNHHQKDYLQIRILGRFRYLYSKYRLRLCAKMQLDQFQYLFYHKNVCLQ